LSNPAFKTKEFFLSLVLSLELYLSGRKIHALLSDVLQLHYIEPKYHLSESHAAFIKLPLMHSSDFFYSKWRRLEGRLSICFRKSITFWSRGHLPCLPKDLKSLLVLIFYWLKTQIRLYFPTHRFSKLKSFFHFCLCQVCFCNSVYFQGNGYNYGRVPL